MRDLRNGGLVATGSLANMIESSQSDSNDESNGSIQQVDDSKAESLSNDPQSEQI